MKKLLFLLLAAYGCGGPKLIVKPAPEAGTYSEIQAYERFASLESDPGPIPNQILIATIELRDAGLTIDCDYETVKRMAERKTRKLGGNCLVITEHKNPDLISSCHRIKGNVLRIPDPIKYETQFLWHVKRPLEIADFKGSTENRPFQAATYSTIRYFAYGLVVKQKKRVKVESQFNCELSYFKTSERDSAVLKHEQVHFDITELYARMFRKTILEEAGTYNKFVNKHEQLFASLRKEWQKKQDEYDSEVYTDRSKQEKWDNWIKEELLKYTAYENPILELPMQ